MINLTCMFLLVGTLVLKRSVRVLATDVVRYHITQFLVRWVAAMGLLGAGLLAHWLLSLDAPSSHVAVLTTAIDTSLFFALTTMIWSLVLLLLSIAQRSSSQS